MTKLDLYWMTNLDWWDYADDEGTKPILTDNAPIEAKISFSRYMEQMKETANKAS